jgi:hypothetical protein
MPYWIRLDVRVAHDPRPSAARSYSQLRTDGVGPRAVMNSLLLFSAGWIREPRYLSRPSCIRYRSAARFVVAPALFFPAKSFIESVARQSRQATIDFAIKRAAEAALLRYLQIVVR